MHVFNVFITAVFFIFLFKLRWPKAMSVFDKVFELSLILLYIGFICSFQPEPTILLACGTTMLGCRETGTLLGLCNQANPFHCLWGRPSNLPRMCVSFFLLAAMGFEKVMCVAKDEKFRLYQPRKLKEY